MHPLVRLVGVVLLSLFATACSKSTAATSENKKEEPAGIQAAPSPSAAAPANPQPTGPALRVAYSDWPGWVAWEIAIQKGWFAEAGVAVDFKWFEYVPSMEAFSAGKVDAVCVTNGDALVTAANGSPNVGILVNDYSNGNDMVVAKPGITTIAQLKGKKIGVEVGFVSHLLLMNALKSAGMTDKDVTLVNVPTDQTPQTLKSGSVDAIVAWQPNSGQALREVPGSTPIYTSANIPGIIYDLLVVNPKSLAERKTDWIKVVKVWDRIAKFIREPNNLDEAAKIMSARVGLTPEQYKPLMKGTYFLDLEGGKKALQRAEDLTSVYGSNKAVDEFNVKNKVYKAPVKFEEYLDASLTESALK